MFKKYAVWIALLLTLLATYWTATQEGDEPESQLVAKQSRQNNRTEIARLRANGAVSTINAQTLIQRPIIKDTSSVNIFSTFTDSPALAANETVIETPQAPANPYIYAGKIVEDGKIVVFLTDGVKNHAVKTGDMLDDVWKVQAIRPPEMILRYVPLKTEVNVQIGALS